MTNHFGITVLCVLCLIVCFIKGDHDCSSNIKQTNFAPCPEGLRDDGISCWKDSYGRGAGRIPDKSTCEYGQRDDGTSCWVDSYGRGVGRNADKGLCPAGLRDDGTSCWNDAHIYGKGCCCTLWGCCNKCPSGYTDDGCTCRKVNVGIKRNLFQRLTCRSTEDKYGSLCYPKCRTGYTPVGCCICQPKGGPRIVQHLKSRQSCRENETMHGSLCYPKCKADYRSKGCCICEPNDGPGIKISFSKRQFCEGDDLKFNGVCINTEGCSSSELVDELKKVTELSPAMIDNLKQIIAASRK